MVKIRLCARCGVHRDDDVDSDVCGSCADDLRQERLANEGNVSSLERVFWCIAMSVTCIAIIILIIILSGGS